MQHERPTAPLSPPTSPRMSDTPAKAPPYHWQQPQYVPVTPNVPHGDQNESLQHFKDEASNVGDQSRPPLRTYKSFPYSLGPSSRFAHDATHSTSTEQQIGTAYSERLVTFGPQPTGSSDLQPATYGGSAPTSPAGRLTPQSGAVPASNEQVDEDEEIEMDDLEGGEGEEKPPMTAAELRAAKRKMKRFRLTHNQTRFLMSEFARQAHPDAAHRERLSREIPGLSPRQVQVWFQNRRAKLKRMTTDDRDRMMRSRALPENFDMTQALHSPFGGTQPPMGTPMPTPGAFSQFGGGDVAGVRPLTLDTLRRVPDYDNFGQHNQYTSPTGISPALGAFTFTPPHSATETVSPGSATGDMTSFGFQHRPQDSPRRPPFGFNGMPLGAPSPGFGSHQPQMPRLGFDRFTRPESVSSPLRTSMSYSSLGNGSTQPNQAPERSSSFSEQSLNSFGRTQQHRSLTNPASAGPGPYGLGFTYSQIPTYQSNNDQTTQSQPASSTSAPNDPSYQHTRRENEAMGNTPVTTYPQYQTPSFATSQMPQYAGYTSAYAPLPSFTSPYQPPTAHELPPHTQAQAHAHTQYATMPDPAHHFGALGTSADTQSQDHGNTDDNNRGIAVPPPY